MMDQGRTEGSYALPWSPPLKRIIPLLLVAMIGVAACSDAREGEILAPFEEAAFDMVVDPECDPWEDLHWCQCEEEDPISPEPPCSEDPDPTNPPGGSPPFHGDVTLECDKAVVRGSEGGCALTITGNIVVSNVEWEAAVLNNTPTASNKLTWKGVVAMPQTWVTVTYDSNLHGSGNELTDEITVQARSLSWSSLVDNQQADSTEVDACLDPTDAGRAVGSQCTSPANADAILVPADPGDGYDLGVGTGPNEGIFFVANPTIHLSMRSVVARRYRPDGDPHPVQGSSTFMTECGNGLGSGPMNNHQVNGSCPGTDFTEFVAHVWAHENEHLDLAEAEAVKESVDLHALWEDIVHPDSGTVTVQALQRWTASTQAIFDASQSLDQGAPTNPFQFWRHLTGIGFDTFNIVVH